MKDTDLMTDEEREDHITTQADKAMDVDRGEYESNCFLGLDHALEPRFSEFSRYGEENGR